MTAPRSCLPEVLAEIVEVAGAEAAWALARAHGGTTIYIPAEAAEDHWLTALVGAEAAAKICRHFRAGNSGQRILIPIAKQAAQRQRLYRALSDGMSAPAAASLAGMHERSSYRARKRLKKNRRDDDDDSQGKLI